MRTAACYKYLVHGTGTWYHTWYASSPYNTKKAKCLFLHGAAHKILHSYKKVKKSSHKRMGQKGSSFEPQNILHNKRPYCCFLSHCIPARCSQQSKFANFQSPPHPHQAPQHCRTTSRRHRDQPHHVACRGAYSRVEQYSHVPPTHPRKAYQLLRWPSCFTRRVYSQLANLYV